MTQTRAALRGRLRRCARSCRLSNPLPQLTSDLWGDRCLSSLARRFTSVLRPLLIRDKGLPERREKRSDLLPSRAGKAKIVSQVVSCRQGRRCDTLPCLHLFLFPSSPAVVVWEQCRSRCSRRLPPATGAVSAKITTRSVTVLCCNALDSSFLALPLTALLPTCFLSPLLTCAQSHMRRHC